MAKTANVIIHDGQTKIYSGNVNIDNRIYTNETLKDFGHGIYEITSSDDNDLGVVFGQASFFINPPPRLATATIDGCRYTGKRIYIEGLHVKIGDENSTEREITYPSVSFLR